MFTDYITSVMSKHALYEIIEDNEPFFGKIKGFQGVWAQGKTLKECEKNLQDVLEEWVLLKIRKKKVVPATKKYDINALLSS
jgi:predicted RNase H-like HicB family nuclease